MEKVLFFLFYFVCSLLLLGLPETDIAQLWEMGSGVSLVWGGSP